MDFLVIYDVLLLTGSFICNSAPNPIDPTVRKYIVEIKVSDAGIMFYQLI